MTDGIVRILMRALVVNTNLYSMDAGPPADLYTLFPRAEAVYLPSTVMQILPVGWEIKAQDDDEVLFTVPELAYASRVIDLYNKGLSSINPRMGTTGVLSAISIADLWIYDDDTESDSTVWSMVQQAQAPDVPNDIGVILPLAWKATGLKLEENAEYTVRPVGDKDSVYNAAQAAAHIAWLLHVTGLSEEDLNDAYGRDVRAWLIGKTKEKVANAYVNQFGNEEQYNALDEHWGDL